ncbi:hypothetical protein FA10DRAFT_299253 [Acaromyces ingoldii]|uniref:ferric-chelate reductase (NADPH) n=1 Tax=Acaromyces ingoldii TaxID=215250 RepID=A0A316YXY7_9BASI|nr:hypothetical protein FA10DRAFT_299253 [Acaromyces ingoldii]PWN93916.1 hypothetical protein FA10DRAFT_299253 [Acaromyces ingoldii]
MASVYVPPAKGTGSGYCTGSCATQDDNRRTYLAGYFNAHMLSVPSQRYLYLTWIVMAAILVFAALLQHLGLVDQTWIGAAWNRWAIKSRVVKLGKKSDPEKRAKEEEARTANLGLSLPPNVAAQVLNTSAPHRQGVPTKRKIFTFPSFGRMLLLAALVIVPVIFTFVGADYIRPSAGMFDLSESWPNNSLPVNTQGLYRRLQWGIGQYHPVTTTAPSLTLPYRTWWTAGGRTGAMTNALTPFILVTALRQVPFAIFSLKIFGGYGFDRLSFMHKWGGRVLWAFATAHVVLWSVQLDKDQAFGTNIWAFVFLWTRFRWGFVSYIFFTLLILLSISPMRSRYYEIFYVVHVICVIGFMVAAWLHHPPLGAWMWATLIYWAAERVCMATRTAWINGLGFAGRKPQFAVAASDSDGSFNLSHQAHRNSEKGSYGSSATRYHSHNAHGGQFSTASSQTMHGESFKTASPVPPLPHQGATLAPSSAEGPGAWQHDEFGDSKRRLTSNSARYDPVMDVIDSYNPADAPHAATRATLGQESSGPVRYTLEDQAGVATDRPHSMADHYAQHSHDSHHTRHMTSDTMPIPRRGPRPAMPADVAALIKPGFAFVQLLPGKTLRLTLRTPNRISWAPGQYINLNVPAVRFWESHPFTIASASNINYPVSTADEESAQPLAKARGEERTIVLLLRARKGFTLHLWNHVLRTREAQIQAAAEVVGPNGVRKTTTGVHLRAIVDGPYGSSQRTRWGIHSTVVIICGGSGISFGMSVLEYLCAAMTGATRRDSKFQTQRIRFVWMLREFSHLQWIASALRRCIEMVSPEQLLVELYVTHFNNLAAPARARGAPLTHYELSPPRTPFAPSTPSSLPVSRDDLTLSMHGDAIHPGGGFSSDGAYQQQARFTEGPEQEEYEYDAHDLTQFEGEDYSVPSAAERDINERLRKEGKLRRAATRKATMKRAGRGKGASRMQSASPSQQQQQQQQQQPQQPLSSPAMQMASQRAIHDQEVPLDPLNAAAEERDLGDRSIGIHSRQQSRADPSSADTFYSRNQLMPPPHQLPPFGDYSGTSTPYMEPSSSTLTPGDVTPSSWDMRSRTPDGRHAYVSGAMTPPASEFFHGDASSTANLVVGPGGGQEKFHGGAELQTNLSHLDAPIDLDVHEDMDLRVVAELARPGYPKLDRIIRQEAHNSAGRVLVATCGPQSLGTLVRSLVARQIDPSRVRKGDLSAQINVVTESYEWGG